MTALVRAEFRKLATTRLWLVDACAGRCDERGDDERRHRVRGTGTTGPAGSCRSADGLRAGLRDPARGRKSRHCRRHWRVHTSDCNAHFPCDASQSPFVRTRGRCRTLPSGMDGRPAICHVRTRDGVRIAYHCLGSGPPLVLLFPYHVNDLVRNWMVPPHRQGMPFLANELTVINLDLRGAGQSAAEVDDLSLDGFCTDIQAVLEDVGVERAAVCALGNSIPIAAQLARTCPGMVSRLVLIEAGESETSMRLFALRILNPGMGADLRASAVAGLTDPDTSAALSDVMRHAVSPRNFVRYVELYERAAPADPLAGVATSTLLVHAADDELIPVSVGREIAARGSDAHLMVLPGSSGLVMWEESALDRIVSFASGAWSGDPGEVASTRPLGRRGRGKASGADLTGRERAVLQLVAMGRTNREIGAELFISLNTVSHHLRAIFAKTSSANRTEAAAFAHRHGLTR